MNAVPELLRLIFNSGYDRKVIVSMRIVLVGLLFCCAPLFAAGVLSLNSTSTAAGMPDCNVSDPASVSCNVVSEVLGVSGQPTAGLNASMILTGSGDSWHLSGNASIFQNYPPVDAPTPYMQTNLIMTATLDLPTGSGNWIVSGTNFQGENQQPQINGPVQVNGQSITSRDERFPTVLTIMHQYGTPLQISVLDDPLIYQLNSGEGLSFDLDFTDASAFATAPEPATWEMAGIAFGVLLLTRAYKSRRGAPLKGCWYKTESFQTR